MPARSQNQRGMVFSKRDQYGSKAKTPKKWKWVWGKEWENKGKLPKKVKKKKLVNESLDDFLSESFGDPNIETFVEALEANLMSKGLTYEEADFAIGNMEDGSIKDWAREFELNQGSVDPIADQILKFSFNK